MNALKTSILLAVFLVAGCANKTKEADRLNDEVKSEVCRIKETLPPMSATLAAAERDTAVVEAVVMLSEKVRKSPALIAKTREVNALVKDFKPSDRFTYFFDVNRLDESTVRQIVEAQCPFEFIDDAVEAAAEAPAADALGEPAANGGGMDEAAMAAAESRMRPILMTAIASLAGFLPLVVATTAGANSQQSLGTVIFGGLLVATVLSLGVVPPFYVLVKQLEERWFGNKAPV